jgi:hypothetical protein
MHDGIPLHSRWSLFTPLGVSKVELEVAVGSKSSVGVATRPNGTLGVAEGSKAGLGVAKGESSRLNCMEKFGSFSGPSSRLVPGWNLAEELASEEFHWEKAHSNQENMKYGGHHTLLTRSRTLCVVRLGRIRSQVGSSHRVRRHEAGSSGGIECRNRTSGRIEGHAGSGGFAKPREVRERHRNRGERDGQYCEGCREAEHVEVKLSLRPVDQRR